jgi:hypothetical protein
MRRVLSALLITAIALVAPATAAVAESPEPVGVHVLWPLCVTLLGRTICIPA